MVRVPTDDPNGLDERTAMRSAMAGTRKDHTRQPLDESQLTSSDDPTPHHDEFGRVVHNAIAFLDREKTQAEVDEVESRQMRKCNSLVTLHVIVHPNKAGGALRRCLVEIVASWQLGEVRSLIKKRAGLKHARFQLLWLDPSGATIDISTHQLFQRFACTMWCRHPWELHVRDQEGGKDGPTPIRLDGPAQLLFERYDIDRSESIGKPELARMIDDLHLHRYIDVSAKLVEGFLDGEFRRLDHDGGASLGIEEWTDYVTSMPSWMRAELFGLLNPKSLFADLAARAVEVEMQPASLAELVQPTTTAAGADDDIETSTLGGVVIETGLFGIRLEIPSRLVEHFGPQATLAVQTLAAPSVFHLAEGGGSAEGGEDARGEFIFTPVVKIDVLSAAEEGSPGGAVTHSAEPFPCPLSLVLPHAFDPSEGAEAVAFLGAQHGATSWSSLEQMTALLRPPAPGSEDAGHGGAEQSPPSMAVELSAGELRVPVCFGGTFCAFSSPTVEDVAAVVVHIFAMPELPRDDPSALRVHLCLHLPDQADEMLFVESSEWGLTECVGRSPVLHLLEGTRLKLKFLEQEHIVTWHGVRVNVEFTIPTCGDVGEEAPPDDPDKRELMRGAIGIDLLEGVGKRSSRIRSVAKRAGIPETGYEVPFTTRLKSEVRPNAPTLRLRERTACDFTLEWTKPVAIDGDGDGDVAEITHYSIELATTAPSGTHLPWTELWCGAGVVSPDFAAIAKAKLAGKPPPEPPAPTPALASGATSATSAPKLQRAKTSAKLQATSSASADGGGEDEPSGGGLSLRGQLGGGIGGGKPKAAKKGKSAKDVAKEGLGLGQPAAAVPEAPPFVYTLPVETALFGLLRIRCWAEGEVRPSHASNEVKLPRFGGKSDPNAHKDPERQMVDLDRKTHFLSLPQHVTSGKGVSYRIGNAPSKNAWGGDAMPPPPPPTDKERAKGLLMAPVPYDVPRLPPDTPGLQAAGDALARCYRSLGVLGGGGGVLFGLRIDHVLHAVVGTPTTDGQASPRRTVATLGEPLLALMEVAYADVLLPLLDTVEVLRAEWQFVDEKVAGIVAQAATHAASYEVCEAFLSEMHPSS